MSLERREIRERMASRLLKIYKRRVTGQRVHVRTQLPCLLPLPDGVDESEKAISYMNTVGRMILRMRRLMYTRCLKLGRLATARDRLILFLMAGNGQKGLEAVREVSDLALLPPLSISRSKYVR